MSEMNRVTAGGEMPEEKKKMGSAERLRSIDPETVERINRIIINSDPGERAEGIDAELNRILNRTLRNNAAHKPEDAVTMAELIDGLKESFEGN